MRKAKLLLTSMFMIFLIIMLPVAFANELNLIYDANGNLVSGDGKYREYNSLNQLSKIYNGSDSSGLLLEELTYHPTQERILVKKVYNNDSTLKETVYYISEEFVRVSNSSGDYDFTYVKHNGQLVAQQNPDGSKIYIHGDHLGSSTVITNESGDVIENTTYSPFGEVLEGGTDSRYGYEGKEHDSVVGDTDFHFRKYKPQWALFTQPDTLIQDMYDPQSLNSYSFEENNPYRYKDPSGHNPVVAYELALLATDVAMIDEYSTLIEINEDPTLELELSNAKETAMAWLIGGQAVSRMVGKISPITSTGFTISGAITLHGYTKKVALANPQRYMDYLDSRVSQMPSLGQRENFYYPSGVDVRSLAGSYGLLDRYGGSSSIQSSMQNTALSGSGITWYYNLNTGHYTYRADETSPSGSGWVGGGSSGGSSSGGGGGGCSWCSAAYEAATNNPDASASDILAMI